MFATRNSGVCDCYCFWWLVVNIMSKKSVLRFTIKELNALIQDEKARVVLQRSIRKLPLQPYCLNDLRGSIHEVLDANLAKFDDELKGILLSYKNIKIVKNTANILYDDSRLYLTIQADFYLFMPEVGCVLRGIVNKRSADHIGCLVHKAFNVSLPRPECDTDEDWQGYYVEIGQEVTFRVESLDLTGSLPYMLGYLLDVGSFSGPSSETFDEEKSIEKEDIAAAISKFNGFLEQHEDPNASVPTTEHKTKKKHKKNVDLESGANVQDPVSVKNEKFDSILIKDDQGLDEYGSVLKTPKKKKRKNTDQISPIKQEEQTYRIGNDRGTNKQQEEDQLQYEEQILHTEKQIHSSYHLPTFDQLNVTVNSKKKKRKHCEAFYDNEDDYDDENHSSSMQNESVKHKKKKKSKKEKHDTELPNADETVEGDFSIETSQETTNQDKKRRKKKKRDVTEEVSADLREETEIHRTDAYDSHTAMDRPLTTSPEELVKEMQFSQAHFKKLGKKEKPLVSTELATSTPVEYNTKKENKFSEPLRRSKFSVITGTDSLSDFKQTNLLESMDHFSPMHPPILKVKHPKKEKESSPTVQSDTTLVKVKKLKKEKRRSSTQQNPDKIILEDYQHYGSDHVLYHPERNLSWSDTENLMKSATTHPTSSNNSLIDVQETEQKNKTRASAEKLNTHLIKSGLVSPVQGKVKMSKKESRLSVKKKDSTVNSVKRRITTDSNANNNGDHDDDGNNSYDQIIAQCEESGKSQVSNRLIENMTNIKKQPSISRKSFTPPLSATSSMALGGNPSEEGSSSDEDKVLKNIPTLSSSPSSERSPKHSRITAVNQASSQTTRSSDRACSSDSGLSLSATSVEKDSTNLANRDSKREADSMYSAESRKDERHVKEQDRIVPKTPKRKKIGDAEEGKSPLAVKHRIKKEKESPVSQPSRHTNDNVSPLRDDDSLEAERMKILADMIKKLEDGNKEDLYMKDESHKPRSSSAVKARRQSKQDDTKSDSDLDTSKSKKTPKKKESNKFKVIRNSVGEAESMQQSDVTSYFKPSAEKLLSVSADHAGEEELHGNGYVLGEGSPAITQAKISGKTPRRKSVTGTEGSSSKPLTKTPVKIKKKESPNKRKITSSSKSDNKEGYSLGEESAGAMAERLLEDFLKRRSL